MAARFFVLIAVLGAAFGLYWMALPPTLSVDSGCRNEIRLNHVDGTWLNGGPIPLEWQLRRSVEGEFERLSESEGIFRAEGFDVMMYEGIATLASCETWPDPV